MQIFTVVRKDRHTDDEITSHMTLDRANDAVDEFLTRYDREWSEQELTPRMKRSGWLRFVTSGEEGPCVVIEEAELDTGPRAKVAIFAEESFEEVEDMSDIYQARAFARGVSRGASFYGAGSCSAYVLPEELDEMREHEPAEEVERALKAAGMTSR